MSNHNKTIRDFIYLDGDRLNSLYSQLFEGVAEQIVKSRLHSEVQQNLQKGDVTKGQIAEAQFAEMKQSTESKVLYDYMYTQLASELGENILEPSDITSNNYRERLAEAFMVKVKGKAEIEDYNRMKSFADQFNDLAGLLAFAETINQLGMPLYQAEAAVAAAQGKQKGDLRKYIQKVKDSEALAKAKGYYQDKELLSLVGLITEMFYPEGFEVVITPTASQNVIFRGVIDKQWLRLTPDFLKALYGGYTEFEWTMVGQVTFMPGGEKLPSTAELLASMNIGTNVAATKEKELEDDLHENLEQQTFKSSQETAADHDEAQADERPPVNVELPSMRDPFRAVFGGLRAFERTFLESKARVEVVMHPLAIYRETSFTRSAT
jgi:DNA-binding transcriptional regulator YhcF (GntR family)